MPEENQEGLKSQSDRIKNDSITGNSDNNTTTTKPEEPAQRSPQKYRYLFLILMQKIILKKCLTTI